jgi:hypothetical protein
VILPVWLAVGPTSPDLAIFAQYGVLGVFAMGLAVFARGAVKREQDRGDRLEAENRRLNEAIQDRVIPALNNATRAAEQSTELLRDMQRDMQRDSIRDPERRRPNTRNGDG